MKKNNPLITLVGAAVLLNLTACTYIKNLFPDKEKDYQFTTEIPALVLPANLGKNAGLKTPATVAAPSPATDKKTDTPIGTATDNTPNENPVSDSTAVANNQPADSAIAITAFPDEPTIVETPIDNVNGATDAIAPTAKPEAIPVELIKVADGNAHLRLGVPPDKAWRTIDKALSRKGVEVTNRDKQENTFNIHYDPNEKKLEDGSLWDEALFIFSGFQGDEKEFFVKLIDKSTETKQQTDVVILDKTQQQSSDAGALNLLNLLQETIKTDFAK